MFGKPLPLLYINIITLNKICVHIGTNGNQLA